MCRSGYELMHIITTGQEFFAVEVAANSLVSSSELCMRLIRQAARALYNDSYPSGMAHLCRLPTQIPMKWWPRETLRAGEVIHILGEDSTCIRYRVVYHFYHVAGHIPYDMISFFCIL